MSIATGVMTVRCNECQVNHTIQAEDADFEVTSTEQRQQGTESCHTWEHTIECNCGNEIEITYEVSEYPQGTFNEDNLDDVTGGTIIDKFGYDFFKNES